MDKNEKVSLLQSPLEEVMRNSMLPYAEYVIMDRALPRVEDGLKPVQRRILYTMYELGLTPDKPHKKCARIVGDCMGKYHPHGDRSVYDAMVRMAQDFNMRMTLVNGHGNFGSVDGDPAAAMRYTEAKMDELALELLRDLDKDTVNFNLNFDDSLKEPDTLPGRYPNLLVNGSSGIAVGLATNIPPHNLAEVIDGVAAYIDNPKIDLKAMMKIIKGPDFPTGGYVIADELVQAYETGRGKITMRAKINVESEGEKKLIAITELPYQVNKANLLKKIADLREEKKDILSGISDIVDESDRNGMRAVIKLKKDADPDKIVETLLKYSDLECTFGINMVAIAGGKPKQMGLLEIIAYYVAYQRDIIYKRTRYELNQAKDRCHILEGLIIAVKNIDEVIKIIKSAESVADARAKLRSRFDLSERQAQAILDLRLARLTKMEIEKLKQELKELKELIARLQAIVDSKKLQFQLVKDEMLAIKKQYKDARRSHIYKGGEVIKIEKFDEMKEACPCYLVVSPGGALKKISEKNFSAAKKNAGDKTTVNEAVTFKLLTKSDSEVLLFTNCGNCIKVNMMNVPEHRLKDRGAGLRAVCAEAKPDERVVFAAENNLTFAGSLLFITKAGMIKKSECPELLTVKAFYPVIKLKEGDEVVSAAFDAGDTTIFFVTKNGMCLNAVKEDIPVQGRVAGGVKGINLSDGDYVLYGEQIDNEGEIILAHANGMAKRVISCLIDPMARYRKGVKIADITKSPLISAGYVKEPYDLIFVNGEGEVRVISTEDISIESRTSKPKPIKGVSDKTMSAMHRV